MFKMIKEAQAIAKLGDKLALAKQVQEMLGAESVHDIAQRIFAESDMSQFEVTPQDYQQWLQFAMEDAEAEGISLKSKRNFMDVVMNILDNDSKIDALGGNVEVTKGRIADILWQSYKTNQAHQAVQGHVQSTINQAREEEEAIKSMLSCDEEEEESGFNQMMRSAVGAEDEQSSNPHRPGTLRHSIWNEINRKKKLRGSEDEEFDEFGGDEELPPEALAARIVGGEDDFADEDCADDIDCEVDDTQAEIEELKARVAQLEQEIESDPDDGLESLGNKSPDSAPTQGVSIAADAKVDPRMDGEEADFEDEETKTRNMFHKAVTAPREHLTQAIKDIEAEGEKAWRSLTMPKNPHPKQSQAYKAWQKGLTKTAKEVLGIKDKPAQPASKARKK